tara:strand:+ start:260 stop:496 length:237 start_codon:yes stop_codon:yes gene_type:complete
MTKKKKPQQKMKGLEEDPCPICLYGKGRNQHNVPKRVENFNRVKPKEAFGAAVITAKKGVKKPKKPKPKPKPKKPKYS